MKTLQLVTTSLLLIVSSACSPTTPTAPARSAAPAAGESAPKGAANSPAVDKTATCAAEQFVSCHTGEECRRRRTKFLHPKTCYDQANAACTAAACEFGCDIYNTEIGGPKMVLCAPNASSTGNMKICGGFANWACPEGMTCEIPPEPARDAQGKCVAVAP